MDAPRQVESVPRPLPPGPAVSLQPSFPRLTDIPQGSGASPSVSPQTSGSGRPPPPPSPEVTKSYVYKRCPPGSARDQGPPVPRCCEHSASLSASISFPLGGGRGGASLSDSRWAPLFRGTKVGDGEGWGPSGPVQAGLARVKVNLPATFSSDDCCSLPPLPSPTG